MSVSNKSSESGHIKSKSRLAESGICGRVEEGIMGVASPNVETWEGVG